VIEPQVRCEEFAELVTDWMEGALDVPTVARAEEHLVICPGCSAYVVQLRRTVGALGALDTDAPPPAARDELLHLFRTQRLR
jgi:Putative zinc-finger